MNDTVFLQSSYSFIQEFYDSRANWLVQDFLTQENFTIIAGQPQAYKTYLGLDLATAVVTGNSLFGQFPVHKSGNVIIIQMEDSNKNFAKRLLAIDNHYYNMYPTEVTDEYIKFNRNTEYDIVIPRNYRFSFDNNATLLQLEKMIQIVKPIMIIIDPLRSTSDNASDHFASVGKAIDDQLRPLRDRYKTGFTIIHHSKKSSGDDDIQSFIYGSNLLIGAFESKLILRRVNPKDLNDKRIKVDRLFKEMGNLPTIQLTFNINYGNKDKQDERGDLYSVAVDELSEDERRVDTIAKYLIVNGPQKIGTLFDEYGEQFGYARATSLNYFMEKHKNKFVKNGTKWSVTPDKGD